MLQPATLCDARLGRERLGALGFYHSCHGKQRKPRSAPPHLMANTLLTEACCVFHHTAQSSRKYTVLQKLRSFLSCYSNDLLQGDCVKLGSMCDIYSGVALRTALEHDPDGVLALQAGDFSATGSLLAMPTSRVAGSLVSPRHYVGVGDVVFRSRGPNNTAWRSDLQLPEPLVATAPLMILRPVAGAIDAGFLAWALNQARAARHFARASAGSAVRVVTLHTLEELELKVPPPAVQREIASTADAAARERTLSNRLADRKFELTSRRLVDLVERLVPDFPIEKDDSHE